MNSEHNPLLAQVPLTVSPFITLPKPPTLPHNYATLPSTLPPSILSSPPATSASSSSEPTNQDTLPAYVTASSGFRAHPASIIAQNRTLEEQLRKTGPEAQATVRGWLEGIKERELAEKRRKAPGWLDRDEKILAPRKMGDATVAGAAAAVPVGAGAAVPNLLDDDEGQIAAVGDREVNDLGAAMDRAFG